MFSAHLIQASPVDEVQYLKGQIEIYKEQVKDLRGEVTFLKGVIENKLDRILNSTARQRESFEELVLISRPREGLLPRTDFDFTPIDTEEKLQNFNEQLGIDPNLKKEILRYLQRQISRADVDNRMHDLIYCLFTKPFFARFTWSGVSRNGAQKIALKVYIHIFKLFHIIGGNAHMLPSAVYVADFLKNNIKHSGTRIHLSETTKTSSHKKRTL